MEENFKIDLSKLVKVGSVKKYEADEVIFYEGDQGKEIYFILKGKVGVFIKAFDGSLIKVTENGMGDFFGEMSLLNNEPRSASIHTLEDTVLYCIDQEDFTELIYQQPELAYRLMQGLSRRIRSQNKQIVELKWQLVVKEQMENIQIAGIDSRKEDDSRLSAPEQEGKSEIIVQEIDYKPAHQDYATIAAPESHELYLFPKNIDCPVCAKKFSVSMVRQSKLKMAGMDPDLRQRFTGFDPDWYLIWVCPACYYANLHYDFYQLMGLAKKALSNASLELKKKFSLNFSNPPNLAEIIQQYQLTLACLKIMDKKDLTPQAKIWLRLAWFYDDVNNKEMYMAAIRKAFELYKEVYYNGSKMIAITQVARLSLLLGELSFKLSNYEEALMFFRKAIVRNGGEQIVNRQAEDRIIELRSLLKN